MASANSDKEDTTPAPSNPPKDEKTYPSYSDDTLVMVEFTDGTLVSCTYETYKKDHKDSGAKVLHKFVPSSNPRTRELEKKLEAYADSLTD